MNEAIQRALDLWFSGGWAMIPLAVNALILYGKAADVHLRLRARLEAVQRCERQTKRSNRRARGEAEYQAAINFLSENDVDLEGADSLGDVEARFAELRSRELPPINRDLRFLKFAMAAAPLLGLLGTVTGMLSTFAALSAGSGGDKTMDQVAGGISEALITTQTGLMIALPGYFLFYVLTRHRDRLAAFILHLETVCAQHVHRSGAGYLKQRRRNGVAPAPRRTELVHATA